MFRRQLFVEENLCLFFHPVSHFTLVFWYHILLGAYDKGGTYLQIIRFPLTEFFLDIECGHALIGLSSFSHLLVNI